jgi:hypothetical protein
LLYPSWATAVPEPDEVGPIIPAPGVVDQLVLAAVAGTNEQFPHAVRNVIAERRRQIAVEGFDHATHDAVYSKDELVWAAMSYLALAVATPEMRTHWTQEGGNGHPWWPWAPEWFKPKTPRQDLVRAAALILAEIERRDRLTGEYAGSWPAASTR